MSTSSGGPPSLATIASLVRIFLNDWQAGLTSTPGEGQITTNNPTVSPQTLPALNSAIRWVYRKMRNVGDPRLIRDNVQLALPANAVTGTNIQTYLAFNGYFDGVTLNVSPTLPSDMLYPIFLWEQQTNAVTTLPFVPMMQPQQGLPSGLQTSMLQWWEWREQPASTGLGTATAPAGIFFLGSITPITVRIRYMATLVNFSSLVSADYATSYVPLMDCEEAVAYRAAYIIASALSGITPGVQALKQEADDAIQDLRNTVVRRQQTVDYFREVYGPDWRTGYDNASNLI